LGDEGDGAINDWKIASFSGEIGIAATLLML
jgi:hypothetical protein